MAIVFDDVRFPEHISSGASGGPERRTDVFTMASGDEERNQLWANSRWKFDIGVGVRHLNDMHEVLGFFEARSGRARAFRFKFWGEYKSCPPMNVPQSYDQRIGTADGTRRIWQLFKVYNSGPSNYTKTITKPAPGTIKIEVGGNDSFVEGVDYTIDYLTGVLTFAVAPAVDAGHIAWGGEFDFPVRFDTDNIAMNLTEWSHGQFPSVPLIEVRRS